MFISVVLNRWVYRNTKWPMGLKGSWTAEEKTMWNANNNRIMHSQDSEINGPIKVKVLFCVHLDYEYTAVFYKMNSVEWCVPVSSQTGFVNIDKDIMFLLSLAEVQGQYYRLTEQLLKDKANLNQLSLGGSIVQN